MCSGWLLYIVIFGIFKLYKLILKGCDFIVNYIIVDLEATTELNSKFNLHEVIQIGAVKVNNRGEILGTFSKYVKPKLKPIISKYCKKLTGITQDNINKAKGFREVLLEFYDFCGDDVEYLVSWGSDYKLFNENCLLHRVKNKFKKRFVDYQDIIKKKYGVSQVISLSKIADELELSNNYTHDALDDSLVLLEWLNTRGFNKSTFDTLPMDKKTYVTIYSGNGNEPEKEQYYFLEKVVDEYGVCVCDSKKFVPNIENVDKLRLIFIRFKKYIKEGSIIFTDKFSEEYVLNLINYVEYIDSFHMNNPDVKFNFHKQNI